MAKRGCLKFTFFLTILRSHRSSRIHDVSRYQGRGSVQHAKNDPVKIEDKSRMFIIFFFILGKGAFKNILSLRKPI